MLQRIGLKKIVLKVTMCCPKCAEIVAEGIKEVGGKCSSYTESLA